MMDMLILVTLFTTTAASVVSVRHQVRLVEYLGNPDTPPPTFSRRELWVLVLLFGANCLAWGWIIVTEMSWLRFGL